ncbi:MAG: type II toxin-antitoxin system VapC family toxin [Thermoanaerobaculia bacterium]
MKLLLDTHILLWWVAGDRKLPRSLRDRITSAENDVSVSAATFWEIAIKMSLGRIDIDLEELRAAVNADGFTELPVQIAHTLRLQELPESPWGPFRPVAHRAIDC